MKSTQPFIIGIAGGTASGKTTVARNIISALPNEYVTCISCDDYYREQSHLSVEERKKTNYDHPNAFEIELLVRHLKQLQAGQSIQKPIYDFTQDTRAPQTEELHPTPVIIIEGILLFWFPELRNLFQLKVFVDTDADLRILRRIERDIKERGRSFEYVISKYLNVVRPMHLEFVEPSKRYADIIIPEGGENHVALDLLLARVREVATQK